MKRSGIHVSHASLGSPALAALAAVVAFGSGCPLAPSSVHRTAPSAEPAPSARANASRAPRKLAAGEEAPLGGERVDAKEGDWLLTSDDVAAVVSAKTGRLLDFGMSGGRDEIVSIGPSVSLAADGAKAERTELEGIDVRDDGALAARFRVIGSDLVLHALYTLEGGLVRIESFVASTGGAAGAAFVGESIAWGNVPTWVEGAGDVGVKGAFTGDFVGRDALHVAYALGVDGKKTTAHFPPPGAGFWSFAHTANDVGAVPAKGESQHRVARLAVSTKSIGDAAMALPSMARAGVTSFPVSSPSPAGSPFVDVEVARCAADGATPGAPFAMYAVPRSLSTIALPVGCFVARLVFSGHAPGAWVTPRDLGNASGATLPRAGRLAWRVTERGRGPIPARLVVRGVAPTPDPSWGEDPIDGASLNVLYAERSGERALPPGHYKVTVTRGFEYTSREIDVTIDDRKVATIDVEIDRVVDTRGWLTADLHVHAIPSSDAPARLADRMRSLAAAGVEVAVATDHNVITDYAPAIQQLGLGAWLASIVGDEITTKGTLYGHFNLFPLAQTRNVVPYENTTPHAIASAARAAAPADRDKVLQLNHPRMGDIGYFDILGFDPTDVAGWQKRTPLAELGFDAIELFNGDHYAEIDRVEQCMRDWYALLDAGIRITATGNSDSHKLTYHEAGVPWNYVQVANDDPAKLDERAFVEAIRKGRVVVSSGPFVRITANGHGIGDSVAPGSIDVAVRVDAPPWVDVDRVDLVGRGGVVLKTWPVKAAATATTRLDVHTRVAAKHGDWLVAVARGTKPMTFLHRPGAKPFGFTNPIWVQ